MDFKKSLIIENLYNSNREARIYTGMSYRNCFENNRPVTINSMFNECSAVHLHPNALQVIQVHGAATPTSF